MALAQVKVAAADTRVASLGVSVVADPGAGVTMLTRDQVGSIFSGTITNWSQVGGASLPITVITRGGGSPVQTAFEKVYLAGSPPSPGQEVASSADALARVASTAGAVTFVYDEEAAAAAGSSRSSPSATCARPTSPAKSISERSAQPRRTARSKPSAASAPPKRQPSPRPLPPR